MHEIVELYNVNFMKRGESSSPKKGNVNCYYPTTLAYMRHLVTLTRCIHYIIIHYIIYNYTSRFH